MKELIAAVRAHALANYETAGWDYVVECYTDEELAQDIGDATTAEEAIKAVGEVVGLLNERRDEVQREAF